MDTWVLLTFQFIHKASFLKSANQDGLQTNLLALFGPLQCADATICRKCSGFTCSVRYRTIVSYLPRYPMHERVSTYTVTRIFVNWIDSLIGSSLTGSSGFKFLHLSECEGQPSNAVEISQTISISTKTKHRNWLDKEFQIQTKPPLPHRTARRNLISLLLRLTEIFS